MRTLKAAVIGAGSTYTPELIEGFIDRHESLNFQTFYLMDINKEKLETVGGLAKRMLEKNGFKGELVLTCNLDEAIDGADYVFTQIRVGGMAARIRDEKIPLKYGLLGQETTGAGGFMNALRTVPVMLDIASRIEKLAPNAWLINFANPSGIVTEALLNHTKVKTIGLCNCPISMLADVEKKIGTSDFDYDFVGLNHLSWITSITVNGEDILSNMSMGTGNKMNNIPDISYSEELFAAIPAIPSSYLSYYYLRDEQLKKSMDAPKSRGEICDELEGSLLEQYSDPELKTKPKELSLRGGAMYSTAAVSAVDAIENDKNEYHVVNVKNSGVLSFLKDDDVIETKCILGSSRAKPVPVGEINNKYITGLIQAVKAYEKLAVSAAVNGSYGDALAALMVHPLIGDYYKAKSVLDDMLAANAQYLPKFK